MMGKIFKDGYILFTDQYMSRVYALQQGFRDIIERDPPEDYTPETYKIVYENVVDGIIKKYEKII